VSSAPSEHHSSRLEAARQFEPQASEVAAARGFVSETLNRWGCRSPDVELLVSELATNAVLHARSEFKVSISLAGGTLRVEVVDRNSRLPTPVNVPPGAFSGRGLLLVEALSRSWGVQSHSDEGKALWFEVDL
jgi:anti-sigma regulatory factor (Ser/Thr protein kinase)